jgi:hypothetical protein
MGTRLWYILDLRFLCQWFQDKHVTMDKYGVKDVDLSKVGFKDEP